MRGGWLFALTSLTLGACSDDVGLPDAPLPIDAPPPGTLRVSWTLEDDGAPLTCDQLAAGSVAIEIVKQGDLFGEVDLFNCTSAMGASGALRPGIYDLALSLTGSGGTLAGPIRRTGIVVTSNQETLVEPVAFDVEPSGTLAFRITTEPTGGDNCGTPPGGAGITAIRIELLDAGGACVPTTFAIAAGPSSGTPAGTYASDCAGATHACIASDQELTATEVASGQRRMTLTGLVGADACWRRTSSFTARAAGLTTMLGSLQLIRDTALCPP